MGLPGESKVLIGEDDPDCRTQIKEVLCSHLLTFVSYGGNDYETPKSTLMDNRRDGNWASTVKNG
jgi:hypothetical protein